VAGVSGANVGLRYANPTYGAPRLGGEFSDSRFAYFPRFRAFYFLSLEEEESVLS